MDRVGKIAVYSINQGREIISNFMVVLLIKDIIEAHIYKNHENCVCGIEEVGEEIWDLVIILALISIHYLVVNFLQKEIY